MKPKKIEEWGEIKKQDKKTALEFSLENEGDDELIDDGWRRFDKTKKQKTQKSLE